jgi:hypothetical protein
MGSGEIMQAIEWEIKGSPPQQWTFSLTNNPQETRDTIREGGDEHPDASWQDWPVRSMKHANSILDACNALRLRRYQNSVDDKRPLYVFLY